MAGDATISEESVRKATGKGWKGWFAILDRWGAARRDQKAIAAYLFEVRGVDGWWAQMVAAHYRRTYQPVRRRTAAKKAVRRKPASKKAARGKAVASKAARRRTTRKPGTRRGAARK